MLIIRGCTAISLYTTVQMFFFCKLFSLRLGYSFSLPNCYAPLLYCFPFYDTSYNFISNSQENKQKGLKNALLCWDGGFMQRTSKIC